MNVQNNNEKEKNTRELKLPTMLRSHEQIKAWQPERSSLTRKEYREIVAALLG